jgi:rod shape-determining protein MreC
MAPPSNRRPGFSRRAQYSTFVAYLIAAAGAVLGAFFLVVSSRDDSAMAGARSTATDITAAPAKAAATTRATGASWLDSLSGYFMSGSEAARLRKEVALARVQRVEADALREENRRLKALLQLIESDGKPVAVAHLIGSSHSSTRRFATLAAGVAVGVRPGMPVRTPQGLIGRVLEVGSQTGRVLLVTDSESIVPVRRSTDGIAAFAIGRGDGMLQIRLVNLGVNPLKVGDTLVTSGAGGLYRPGVAMAVVTKLTPDGAIARPLGNPDAAELVIVETEWAASAPPVDAGTSPATGEQQPQDAR